MRFWILSSTTFLALLALFGPTQAAPTSTPSPSPTSTPPIREIGRVVTSDRLTEPIAVTSRPTFVVDRSTIDNIGATTVAAALSIVPGLTLFRYGAFGAQTDYGLRGTTSEQTLVLRDGMPIAAGSNGTVDLAELSTIGVQRIEVVESGSSTLYGAGAVGGVINIITGTPNRPDLRLSTGSFGEQSLAVEVSSAHSGAFYERHVAGNAYSYPPLAYAPGAGKIPAGTRINADAAETALRAIYSTPFGRHWGARVSMGDDAMNLGVPGNLALGLTPQARSHTVHTDGQFALDHSTSDAELGLMISFAGQKLAYIDPNPSDFINGGENDTYDWHTRASLKYAWAHDCCDLVTGIDIDREKAALWLGPAPNPQPVPPIVTSANVGESQAAMYLQYRSRLSAATRLTGGLRYENDSLGGAVAAPSVGATSRLGQLLRIAANVGESYRVPTLIDLYYPGFSNPLLRPEKLTNYDVTLQTTGSGPDVSFGYFGRDGSNLITINESQTQPINASHVSVNGLQLTFATKPIDHVTVTASLTNVYRALDTDTGSRLIRTPPIVATFGLKRAFGTGPISWGADARIVGSDGDNRPRATAVLDAYTLIDAYVRYRFDGRAIATVRVGNLADQRYAPIYGYPAPGRSVSLELSTH
jgi:vitamin B12 transporter